MTAPRGLIKIDITITFIIIIIIIIIILFTNPTAWVGYDTGSIFKRSLIGLNSDFSFS